MIGELALRFVLGGAVVSAFAVIGEVFEPKTFAGLFGAAPSVALATLALLYRSDGAEATATAARWMVIGAVALFVYGSCCVAACHRRRIPVAMAAIASWLAWLGVAFALWFALRGEVAT
jgi:hypothetical protein